MTSVEIKQDVPLEENKYAILQETNGEECESWLYFIRYKGNEEALKLLKEQLESFEWHVLNDFSTFDLETDYLVCEQTAKDMIRVDLNSASFHRKFDGKLKPVNLNFKEKYSAEKKIAKAFNILGHGKIENFIDQEEIIEDQHNVDDSKSDSSDSSEPKKITKLPSISLKKKKRKH